MPMLPGHLQFTDSARQLIAKARAEAHRLRHEYIGTEHLLLALTAQTQGVAATALRSLHIDTDRVRQTIQETVRWGRGSVAPDTDLPFTARTQKVFALAAESAHAFDDREVGEEHLLHGLLRERLGIGAQVLVQHGLSEGACLDKLKQLKSGGNAA